MNETACGEEPCSEEPCSREFRDVLDADTVDRLLRHATVARLIGHDHVGPTVETVPVVAIDRKIYLYADGHSLLGRTSVGASVVLTVDDDDPGHGSNSTIVVHGTARRASDDRRRVLATLLPRPSFEDPLLPRLIEVTPTSVAGTRVRRSPCRTRHESASKSEIAGSPLNRLPKVGAGDRPDIRSEDVSASFRS